MHLVCPFCGKHLRTDRVHAGREGLCPKCDKVFELPGPREEEAKSEEAPEYGSSVVLTLTGGVGLALAFLAASSLLVWSRFTGAEELFLGAQKLAIVVGSLACLGAIAVSLAGRKSLLPAVLVSGAWGITAAVWVAGSAVVMGRLVGELHTSPVRVGMYVALGAACVVVAIAAGLLIVTTHVAPGLRARSDSGLPAMNQQSADPRYVEPTSPEANVAIGNKNWKQGERIRRGQD
jgi:hypothetical protein